MKYRIKRISEDTLDIFSMKIGFSDSCGIEDFKLFINDGRENERIVSFYQKSPKVFGIRWIDLLDNVPVLSEDEFTISSSLLNDERFYMAIESALKKFQKYQYEDFWRINAIKEEVDHNKIVDICAEQTIDTYNKEKRIVLPTNFSYRELYKFFPRRKKDFEKGISFKNKVCDLGIILSSFVLLILGGAAFLDSQFAFNQTRLLLSSSSIIGSFAIFKIEKIFYGNAIDKRYEEFRSEYIQEVRSALKQRQYCKDEEFVEIIDETLEYMRKHSNRNFDFQKNRLEKLKSRFEDLMSIADRNSLEKRFDIVDEFLEIERQVRCSKNDSDTRVERNEGFTLELLYKYLSILGCDRKFCEKDCHLSMLIDRYCEILIYPYTGWEHDLVTITEAAVYYLRTKLLYSSEEAKSDAIKRARDIVDSISLSREIERKHDILTSSSQVLKSLYFSESTEFDIEKKISLI